MSSSAKVIVQQPLDAINTRTSASVNQGAPSPERKISHSRGRIAPRQADITERKCHCQAKSSHNAASAPLPWLRKYLVSGYGRVDKRQAVELPSTNRARDILGIGRRRSPRVCRYVHSEWRCARGTTEHRARTRKREGHRATCRGERDLASRACIRVCACV